MKKKAQKKKLISYAYVGKWDDGELGWNLPAYLTRYDTLDRPAKPYMESHTIGKPHYLCKVTIELVKSRAPNGRQLQRRFFK